MVLVLALGWWTRCSFQCQPAEDVRRGQESGYPSWSHVPTSLQALPCLARVLSDEGLDDLDDVCVSLSRKPYEAGWHGLEVVETNGNGGVSSS
jgi:hypothetical protein